MVNNKSYLFLIFAFISLSCTKVQTLNLKSHSYSGKPKNIIWFQVAGFQEEHLAMARFSAPQGVGRSNFEDMSCVGKIWNYNLYDLRPSAGSGFLSQMVGSKNIKNSCEDYNMTPMWGYVNQAGYKVGVFEVEAKQNSIDIEERCGGNKKFLGRTTLWKMEKGSGENLFHYLGSEKFEKGKVYIDKSCQKGNCFATLFDNLKSIWNRFKKETGQTIFIVRDFSYLKALKERNIPRAREILLELDKSLDFLKKELSREKETLFLVTSSESLNFEMPKKGKEWFQFESRGRHVVFRNTSLLSPIMASGAGAENFCGVYEEFEVVKRIFWSPNKQTWNPLDVF